MGSTICKRCIMSSESDPTIRFDERGFCNYCTDAIEEGKRVYFPNAIGQEKIDSMLKTIKETNADKKYDCVMGISGGLDSSYLAYLGYKWGLRILAVHIDDGYDTEISKENIKRLCSAAGIELRTVYPDKEQYDGLTKAYIKAGVPNLAAPQDNILFAFLSDTVKKENLKYFLSGGNYALECILQQGNTYNSMDVINIKDINQRFGDTKLNKLKFISSYTKYLDLKLGKMITIRPLNYIEYNRDRAFKELEEFCGFEYYGSKHLENILTAFLQLYWLPKKFGVDKRSSHLSSMIISGQITREDALKEQEKPLCDENLMNEYIEIIRTRLGFTTKEFDELLKAPTHQHTEYNVDKKTDIIRRVIK